MDPGFSMIALVQGSTQLQTKTKTKTTDSTPVTRKDFRSLTNVFSGFTIGSSKKQARKKAKTKAWKQSIRVHKRANAENKKLLRQQKKPGRTVKCGEELKLKLKYGDADLHLLDEQREGSITESIDAEEKFSSEEDEVKARFHPGGRAERSPADGSWIGLTRSQGLEDSERTRTTRSDLRDDWIAASRSCFYL